MTLMQKLQSLLTAANARTVANDATLTSAVQRLINGYGGITPSGAININANGTYDVTDKASAVVNVSGGGITKTLLGTVTSPSAHENITDLATIDYGNITFDTIVICRSDGSGKGIIIPYSPSTTAEKSGYLCNANWLVTGSCKLFYVQARDDTTNNTFTIGNYSWPGGLDMGLNKLFNVYACTLNMLQLFEV